MVYFVCGACGTSLKKSQVEAHTYRCRDCQHVSCMDCSKDFWGNDYAEHTSCITEDQKYGGSDFVQKDFKGAKKQEAWMASIREHVASTRDMDPQLRQLLDYVLDYPNIPRKKNKFQNFLTNSCRIKNPRVVDAAWDVFNKAIQGGKNQQPARPNNNTNKTQPQENGATEEEPTKEKVKKDKKRKTEEDNIEEPKSKKKKKKNNTEDPEDEVTNENGENDIPNGTSCASPFKWKTAINKALEGVEGKGLKVNKLKHKVLAQYYEAHQNAAHVKPEGELRSIINKKLERRNDKYVVCNGRVKLRAADAN